MKWQKYFNRIEEESLKIFNSDRNDKFMYLKALRDSLETMKECLSPSELSGIHGRNLDSTDEYYIFNDKYPLRDKIDDLRDKIWKYIVKL